MEAPGRSKTRLAKVGKRVVLGLLVVYIVSIGWLNITRALTTRNIFDELGYATLDRAASKPWIYPEAFGMSVLYPLNPLKYTLRQSPDIQWHDWAYSEAQKSKWLPFPLGATLVSDAEDYLLVYRILFYDDDEAPFYDSLLPTQVYWEPFLRMADDGASSNTTLARGDGVTLSTIKFSTTLSPNRSLVDTNELSERSLHLDGVYDARTGMLEMTVSKPDFMNDAEAVAIAREYFEGYVVQSFCDATNSFRFSAENPGDVTITYKLRGDL